MKIIIEIRFVRVLHRFLKNMEPFYKQILAMTAEFKVKILAVVTHFSYFFIYK